MNKFIWMGLSYKFNCAICKLVFDKIFISHINKLFRRCNIEINAFYVINEIIYESNPHQNIATINNEMHWMNNHFSSENSFSTCNIIHNTIISNMIKCCIEIMALSDISLSFMFLIATCVFLILFVNFLLADSCHTVYI